MSYIVEFCIVTFVRFAYLAGLFPESPIVAFTATELFAINPPIIKLLSERNLRKGLIRNGMSHIKKNYSWKSVVDKFKDIYDSI